MNIAKKYKPTPLFDSLSELKRQSLPDMITLPFAYRMAMRSATKLPKMKYLEVSNF